MADRLLTLGFNARISFTEGRAAQGLRDGVELFRAAEQLGFDTGWVYQRHFDNYLAAPLPFLAAVAERTDRIGLGTAIIGVRYEDPVLLAEAAATTDLLSGGRLQLGLGTGQGGYDAVFGPGSGAPWPDRSQPNDGHEQSRRRLARLLAAVRGEVVGVVGEPAGGVAVGTELRVRPHSPTLADRLWFGAGSVASAQQVGERGLRLLLSTILSGEVADFGVELATAISAYRAAHTDSPTHPTRPSRVAVARSVLPATDPALRRRYAAYDAQRRALGPAASRPRGALAPAPPSRRFTMSPVHHGSPHEVVDQLLADPSVGLAEELICFLPPEFGLRENLRLLQDVVETVVPHLRRPRPDRLPA